MLKLSLTFAFLFGVFICYGQKPHKLSKDTSAFKFPMLYVLKLNNQAPMLSSNLLIDVMAIDSIAVIKEPRSVNLYGEKGKFGVMELHLRPGKPIVNYDQLLVDFNIPYSSSNLPVFIDSAIAYHPKETWYGVAAIKWVRIDTELETGMKYISIRSTFSIRRPEKNEVKMKGKVSNVKVVN
jgi:hypothetical protein